MSGELTTMSDDRSLTDLSVSRPPAAVIEEARKAAVALKDVLDKKPNKVMMNNEQYLEFEDWQTVAQFYGCKVEIAETKPVQFGNVMGFEAKAICFHVASGKKVSSAEAMCLNDEEKWSSRNKYEYVYCKRSGGHSVEDPGKDEIVWEDNPKAPGRKRPKKERQIVSKEPVPLFQLRSMAQTRAGAKAFRNAFAWVVVLAGYKATPAEELPDAQIVEREYQDAPHTQPDQGQAKASTVLDKMKKNGTEKVAAPAGDAQPATSRCAEPQDAHPDGGVASAPTLLAKNVADQLELCENKAEFSQVMNDWQAEVSLHSPEEQAIVMKAKVDAKKRLGIK